MYHPDQARPEAIVIVEAPLAPAPSRIACLNDGCPCKDARIVSHRRAAFFAALARANGETADRVAAVEPGWSIASIASMASLESAPAEADAG
ncbi:MAG: hypothetical protein ACHQ3P_03040 [Candidatus Limnocylindrales bacterium]